MNFFLPILYVLVLGLFFHEESKGGRFLNRDQTDEWKGKLRTFLGIFYF